MHVGHPGKGIRPLAEVGADSPQHGVDEEVAEDPVQIARVHARTRQKQLLPHGNHRAGEPVPVEDVVQLYARGKSDSLQRIAAAHRVLQPVRVGDGQCGPDGYPPRVADVVPAHDGVDVQLEPAAIGRNRVAAPGRVGRHLQTGEKRRIDVPLLPRRLLRHEDPVQGLVDIRRRGYGGTGLRNRKLGQAKRRKQNQGKGHDDQPDQEPGPPRDGAREPTRRGARQGPPSPGAVGCGSAGVRENPLGPKAVSVQGGGNAGAGLPGRSSLRDASQNPPAVPAALTSIRRFAGAPYELARRKLCSPGARGTGARELPGSLRGKNCAGKGARSVPREVESAPAHTTRRFPLNRRRSRALADVLALEDCDHNSYHHIDICRGPYYYFASRGGELCP